MERSNMKRFSLLFLLLALLYSFFLFQRVDFTLEDLGRHLVNGKLAVSGMTDILYKNVYSYSQPDFPFPNHHWLTGVLFYLFFHTFGLPSLFVFHATVLFVGLLFSLRAMLKRSSLGITAFLGFFLVLLLSARIVIRPESFGYAFIAMYIWLIQQLEEHKMLSWKAISVILVSQILWTNLHISFVLGVFLVWTGLASVVMSHRKSVKNLAWKKLIVLGAGSTLATLINPSGLYGAIYPFLMFSNYGYSIVENKSPWFLHTILVEPAIPLYFFFALTVLVLFFVFWRKVTFGEGVRVLTGLLMGWLALRNIPIFALFSFPFLAFAAHRLVTTPKISVSARESVQIFGIVLCCVVYVFGVPFVLSGAYSSGKYTLNKLGAETVSNQFASTDFFQKLNIQGNVFNNYDIGSYLIYALYPKWRVFVDNRPDAFSADFLQRTYIRMQEDDGVWQDALKKYDFQTIFWGHRDITPWGRAFLAARLQDQAWVPVYIDDMAIIFVRNSATNADVVGQYRLSPAQIKTHLKIPL